MRYLLDELMAYEEGFSDIMMGDRASERHETFMGELDVTAPVLKSDLFDLELRLSQKIDALLNIHSPVPKHIAASHGM